MSKATTEKIIKTGHYPAGSPYGLYYNTSSPRNYYVLNAAISQHHSCISSSFNNINIKCNLSQSASCTQNNMYNNSNNCNIKNCNNNNCNISQQHVQQHICTLNNCINNHTELHSKLLVFDIPTSLKHGTVAKVLLDCGSTTNFINKRFVLQNQVKTVNIDNTLVVKLADGSKQSTSKLVEYFSLYFNNRHLRENLLVLPLDDFDIILGMPFLRKYNPHVDWLTNTLTFPPSLLQQLISNLNTNTTSNTNTNFHNNNHMPQCISTTCASISSSSSSLSSYSSASAACASPTSSTTSSTPATPTTSTIPILITPTTSTTFTTPPLAVASSRYTSSNIQLCNINSRRLHRSWKNNDELFLLFVRKVNTTTNTNNNNNDLDILSVNSIHINSNENNSIENKYTTEILKTYRDVFPDDLPKRLPPKRFIEHKINLLPN